MNERARSSRRIGRAAMDIVSELEVYMNQVRSVCQSMSTDGVCRCFLEVQVDESLATHGI